MYMNITYYYNMKHYIKIVYKIIKYLNTFMFVKSRRKYFN